MLKHGFMLCIALFFVGCADAALENNGTNNGDNNGLNNGEDGCQDKDGDGFMGQSPTCRNGNDCNDSSAGTNPSIAEVCGDRQDNNCDGQIDEGCNAMGGECVDNDGDRFGVGAGCFGMDCDDNNAQINPRAKEICGNNIDEDCKEGDLMCATNCMDADGDGYGLEGSTDCEKSEVDCDDSDAKIFPGAKEICNGKDDNCNETGDLKGIDECPGAEQACVDDRCIGGIGSQCENNDDCAGSNVRCDSAQNPKECRAVEGGNCTEDKSCLDGLTCANGKCSGDFCDSNTCSGTYNFCDSVSSACVQCNYADPDIGDFDCPDSDICGNGGWCATESPLPFMDWDNERTINIDLSICWLNSVGGAKRVCWIYTSDSTITTITKRRVKDAWKAGTYEAFYNAAQIDALDDIWGKGLFNLEDIDWNEDLTPNMDREICMWYEPGGTFSEETMVLDLCTNFSP